MANLAEAGRSLGDRFFPAMKFPDYRRLWMASVCSQSAAWALIVARGALAKTLTDSDLWVGMVTFAAMIPSVFMSPIAGFLADRFDRRTVMACAYAVNLAHNLMLALLVVTGSIESWHLVLLALLNGSARSTQMPAVSALLANTVPRERLFNAVALQQGTLQGARFVGPFLVLLMLWVTAPWVTDNQDWVFFLATTLYVLALGFALKIRTSSRGVVEAGWGAGMVFRNVVVGLSYMYRHPLLLSLILLVVAHCAMTMSFESLFPALATDQLGMEPGAGTLAGFGFLMVAYGAPAMVTSLALAGVRGEGTRGRLYLWLGVLSGLSPVALALSPNLALVILSVAVMGASQSGFMTFSGGMVQSLAPDAIRGRLMSVHGWHIQGFMASFNLVNGTLAAITALSAASILGAGGILFVIVMAGSFARVPLRQVYGEGVTMAAGSVQAPAISERPS